MKSSTVSTQYIYQRIHDILDSENKDLSSMLSRLLDELAFNYQIDTGELIGKEL